MFWYTTSDPDLFLSDLYWGQHLQWCKNEWKLKFLDDKRMVYQYPSSLLWRLQMKIPWLYCRGWSCTGRENLVIVFPVLAFHCNCIEKFVFCSHPVFGLTINFMCDFTFFSSIRVRSMGPVTTMILSSCIIVWLGVTLKWEMMLGLVTPVSFFLFFIWHL